MNYNEEIIIPIYPSKDNMTVEEITERKDYLLLAIKGSKVRLLGKKQALKKSECYIALPKTTKKRIFSLFMEKRQGFEEVDLEPVISIINEDINSKETGFFKEKELNVWIDKFIELKGRKDIKEHEKHCLVALFALQILNIILVEADNEKLVKLTKNNKKRFVSRLFG